MVILFFLNEVIKMKFKVRYSVVTGDHHSNEFNSEKGEMTVDADSSADAVNIVEKDPNKTIISVETA